MNTILQLSTQEVIFYVGELSLSIKSLNLEIARLKLEMGQRENVIKELKEELNFIRNLGVEKKQEEAKILG